MTSPQAALILPPLQKEVIPKGYGKSDILGMVFAGLGPAGAAVVSNPFDVAKVRMQLQGEKGSKKKVFKGSFQCIYKTYNTEGLRGIQKGLSASVLREGSKNFFRIGLFHPILEQLHQSEGHAPIWKRLIAGSISGAVGAIICNPIEVIKTRVQASSLSSEAVGYQGYRYKGLWDAFRVISRNEGLAGLWVGTSVSTLRSILSTSANMTINSAAKDALLESPTWAWVGARPGAAADAACSILSALGCVAANNPVDVVRTRLYNQPFEIDAAGRRVGLWYPGAIACARQILAQEGPMAFYKGFTGHFIRTGPHYVVAFVLMGYMERAAVAVRRWRIDRRYEAR